MIGIKRSIFEKTHLFLSQQDLDISKISNNSQQPKLFKKHSCSFLQGELKSSKNPYHIIFVSQYSLLVCEKNTDVLDIVLSLGILFLYVFVVNIAYSQAVFFETICSASCKHMALRVRDDLKRSMQELTIAWSRTTRSCLMELEYWSWNKGIRAQKSAAGTSRKQFYAE